MSSNHNVLSVKVFINNKFYSNYQFIDSFKAYDILESLWDVGMLIQKIKLEMFSNSYYPNDKQRVDKIKCTMQGTMTGDRTKFYKSTKTYHYSFNTAHIKLIKDKDECWKDVVKKIFVL